MLVGAAAVIGVIILLWLFQGMRLSGVNDDIDAQKQTNANLQQEIDGLQKYEDLQVAGPAAGAAAGGRLRRTRSPIRACWSTSRR